LGSQCLSEEFICADPFREMFPINYGSLIEIVRAIFEDIVISYCGAHW
jgi:hypothetical protein